MVGPIGQRHIAVAVLVSLRVRHRRCERRVGVGRTTTTTTPRVTGCANLRFTTTTAVPAATTGATVASECCALASNPARVPATVLTRSRGNVSSAAAASTRSATR